MIDLIYFGKKDVNWSLGQSLYSKYEINSIISAIEKFINTDSPWLLLWDNILGPPLEKEIKLLMSEDCDISHGGLLLGMGDLPKSINYVLPNWMLTLNPASDQKSISWKISPRACLLRKDILNSITLRSEYITPEYAFIDFGYRCIRKGVIIQHVPNLISNNFDNKYSVINHDETLFIESNFSSRWYYWYLFRNLLVGNYKITQIIGFLLKIKSKILIDKIYQSESIINISNRSNYKSVSIIIPTLNRYNYLINLLKQIGEQSILPLEVIIIDQTPINDRIRIETQKYHNLVVKLILLDRPGQCSARNKGLEMAKGEYILFCDDDNELPENFIEQHLMNIDYYKNSVSCGVSSEAGIKKTNSDYLHSKISDVFSTNNSLVPKKIFKEIGLFDLAYDRAIRADKDLGIRMYLSGKLLYFNPKIIVFHHRSPTGGLRTYNQRNVTYDMSRKKLFIISTPSISEFYQSLRYFSIEQNREMIWSSILGIFANHGNIFFKLLQIAISTLYLPRILWLIRKKTLIAKKWLNNFPQIPQYNKPIE